MGCAPSIHVSEGRAAYHGGKEAEDAPPPAGPRLPPGPKTTASPGARGAGLAESEPREGGGRKVRGAGRAAGARGLRPAAEVGPGRAATLPRGAGRGALRGCGALPRGFGRL